MGVFVTAEIGINHNGDMNIVRKLIDAAAVAGCDAVKFQKRTVAEVYTPEYLAQTRESPWGNTQRAQKEGLELDRADYDSIDRYCRDKGIEWYASSWDIGSQLFLRNYRLNYNKIASAMITNEELLHTVAEEKKYTFIATGMSTQEEISHAVSVFRKYNCPFELLHCNSSYPMPDEDANLRMIRTLEGLYHCKVGYSGHETGILVSLCAVAVGAVSVERHITLDKTMYGSDQQASLEPHEMCCLVKEIRNIEKMLGTGEKALSKKELAVRQKLRG